MIHMYYCFFNRHITFSVKQIPDECTLVSILTFCAMEEISTIVSRSPSPIILIFIAINWSFDERYEM